MLLLSEADVRRLLTMDTAIDAVERAFRGLGLDEANNAPRARVQTDHVMLHLLAGAGKRVGYLGYKAYTTTKQTARFHVGLFDGKSGELLALIEADYLGQMRTGAASGVATEFMARPDASEVGLFGAGKQARTQLLAMKHVRKLSRVQFYSRDEERRTRFALEMSRELGVEVEAVQRPEMAAQDKDIVITATSSREPVLSGDWLAPGSHLNVVGSNYLSKAEVDVAAIRRCESIVVDSKDQARLEAGDFVAALEDGSLHWADIHELSQVVVGRFPGRATAEAITLFKSLGIGLEDVAVAGRVYEKAKAEGVGMDVSW